MIPDHWTQTLVEHPDYKEDWKKYATFHPEIQQVLIRSRIPSGTDEWHRKRLECLSATNSSSVIPKGEYGHSVWTSRDALFRIKTGRRSESDGIDEKAIEHGQRYEAEGAEVYSRVTGIELVEEDIGMLSHPEEEYITATPDRLAKYYPINVEIKCPWRRKLGKRKIPDYYYPQVQQQMAVMRLMETHFVQYIPPTHWNAKGTGQIEILRIVFVPSWWNKTMSYLQAFRKEVEQFYEEKKQPIGTPFPEEEQKAEEESELDCGPLVERGEEPILRNCKKRKREEKIVPNNRCIAVE